MARGRLGFVLVWALVGAACTGRGAAVEGAEAAEGAVAQELPRPEAPGGPTVPPPAQDEDFPRPAVKPERLPAVQVQVDGDPGAGTLIVERDDKLMAIPLQHTAVDTLVTGTIAETTVTQLFVNPFDEPIEAIYMFPLPHDAAVDDYWFHVGKRHIHGVMKERAQAKEIYDKARAAGLTAALLEQERPDVFRQSVANVAPGESILVEMHLVHPLEQSDGAYALSFPTVVGPHFLTGRRAGEVAGQDDAINPPRLPVGTRSGHDLSIRVTIDAGIVPADLASKSHRIVTELREDVAVVRLADETTIPNQDFVLKWKLAGERSSAWIMAQRREDEGYFTLTVQPPAPAPEPARTTGRELVFVVDTSGSMAGPPIETVKRAMSKVLDDMGPRDSFQVLRFSENVSSLGPELLPNTGANRAKAQAYLDGLSAEGGTEFIGPLKAALGLPHDPARMRMILLMSDGYVSNDQEVFGTLEASIGEARLFAMGVGTAVNRHLLDGMALAGRGAATYLRPDEDEAQQIARFYERVARPVLTDLTVDWGELAVRDVVPAKIPDLFAGQPVVLFGKFDGEPKGRATVRGRLGGEEVEIPVEIDIAAAQGKSVGLASIWARKRIDDLMLPTYVMAADDGRREGAKKQVIDLALAYAVMTDYTAFVAVDQQRVVDADGKTKTIDVAVPLPQGVTGTPGAGLGLHGTGRGGGGSTYGTIGLGNVGLIGTGGGGGSGYGSGSGAGFGGKGARVPKVRLSQAKVTGALDRDVIRRVVRAHVNEVRHCYDQGLVKDPALTGRVSIAFTIDGKGNVSVAAVKETTLADATVGTCIAKAAKRWKFPAPTAGTVSVEYPLVLEPG
jgi:Ca-activated chloride channel homolog